MARREPEVTVRDDSLDGVVVVRLRYHPELGDRVFRFHRSDGPLHLQLLDALAEALVEGRRPGGSQDAALLRDALWCEGEHDLPLVPGRV